MPYVVGQLMDLAITPSIRKLSGTVNAKEFYSVLYRIVSNPLEDYTHMECIPDLTYDENYSSQVKLKFKDYQPMLQTPMKESILASSLNVLTQLDQFPKLKTLSLAGGIREPRLLEPLLHYTPRLNRLLPLPFQHEYSAHPIMSKSELIIWANRHVKKEFSFHLTVRHDILEYLTLKYPNIKKIEMYHAVAIWFLRENLNTNIMDRLLNAIKPIKQRISLFDCQTERH